MTAAVPEASHPALARLRTALAEVADLVHAESVMAWDSRVSMPHAGAERRAEVAATVGRLAHERFASDEIGGLLEELEPVARELDPESDDAALIRVTRREWERDRRVPGELAGEMRRSNGIAVAAWDEAKAASNFAAFAPHLERQLELKHRYIDCFDAFASPYDVLLSDYEEGMTTARVAEVFAELKAGLVPLIDRLREERVEDTFLAGPFPVAGQKAASARILEAFGFSPEGWRLDTTNHPFMTSPGHGDIRLTTHYVEDDLNSLFSTMHEFGHGVYEWAIAPELARTPLGTGTSSAIHESQSRTWENLVGRSQGFWRWFYPQLQDLFPEALRGVERETFVRRINRVRPSLIRTDSDEVTYGLHIILRFELEQELLAGRLVVADAPESWNARVHEYLGVDVPDDAHGVLQDMHWAIGLFGYFPTYQLGNVISLQIWERAVAALDDVDEQFAQGEFGELREWLREHLYRHGRKFPPGELVQRITGKDLDAEPYLRYLREKFGSE